MKEAKKIIKKVKDEKNKTLSLCYLSLKKIEEIDIGFFIILASRFGVSDDAFCSL